MDALAFQAAAQVAALAVPETVGTQLTASSRFGGVVVGGGGEGGGIEADVGWSG